MKVMILAGGYGSRIADVNDEIPKPMMLVGAFLVVTSSLIIFKRESTLKKQIIPPRA